MTQADNPTAGDDLSSRVATAMWLSAGIQQPTPAHVEASVAEAVADLRTLGFADAEQLARKSVTAMAAFAEALIALGPVAERMQAAMTEMMDRIGEVVPDA